MAMAPNLRTLFLFVFAPIFIFFLLHRYSYDVTSDAVSPPSSSAFFPTHSDVIVSTAVSLHSTAATTRNSAFTVNNVIAETHAASHAVPHQITARVGPSAMPGIHYVAVLLPDWEVLVIGFPDSDVLSIDVDDPYVCLFGRGISSPASPAGVLPFPDRLMFKCELPIRARRRMPYKQPVLVRSSSLNPVHPEMNFPPDLPKEIPRWNFMAYDSLTTEDDVVLFVKGVNHRQGVNRDPAEFRCTFFDGAEEEAANAVKTVVTSSMQEVFRCKRPEETAARFGEKRIKVTLEIIGPDPVLVPSVAYYSPTRKLASKGGKALLCAVTMVRNVAKFLKEWVLYHSEIGVDQFILYDNGSDDDLESTVDSLRREGFDISTVFWLWPKTQEAGFSHSAVYAKDACRWVMYTDVDEFVYSPAWAAAASKPSKSLLQSLVAAPITNPAAGTDSVGQISIACLEFGPSGQNRNPESGVTQGYNCRKEGINRHKSIVLLEAIDDSLTNVIHHFILKPGYMTRRVGTKEMVVNHYKFQAWPEFRAKFRRRVSAYVIDWTQPLNPKSKDRAPGLGYSAVEPENWPAKFCEVYDDGLKDLTRRWFAVVESRPPGAEGRSARMAWQR
ncbi:unnamed protein product [Cuscuta campestris]|uniref:Glycosyltransferase family 92 protein n=1 Tax=Cuscuta campestris TaxID=132261 RepID=A0A484L9D1_9ASTE|nr:unnamed protein product [Cuscuta campestris]